ncbi:helix-turn-helix transcriptional regulator [Nitrosomonas communis]|uniref:DNA-binding transcriptional regulator, CsgD family n=1 Tax=Nitrosomonas communis TaxID=44574 RepID=A0A1I4TDD3_9PROT|nr:hypothetical protein [Nitrosomonas communis]SFM74641.1 hypothetical protein SAMN05421863_104925 [Nitrosomonas communis]
MAISTPNEIERRNLPRRIADRFINDLYKTCSTPQCHSCLERTSNAVLLLDSEKRVMYTTSEADKIISQASTPFTLTPRFALLSPPNAARFEAFVNRESTEPGPLIQLLTNKKDRGRMLFSCFRLPEPDTASLHVARYLVMLRDPDQYSARQWQLFTEQYNLTKAETRLCRALADGLTLNDYCTNWQVMISTARSQLSSIFAKTETRRQIDLLRLIYLFTLA